MSNTPPDETPEWLEDYLDAGRDVPALPPEAEARMLARLVGSAGGGGGSDSGPGAETALPAAAVGAGKVALAVTGMLGVVLGTVIGVVSHAALTEPEVRVVERVVTAPAATPPEPSPTSPVVVPEPAPAIADAGVARVVPTVRPDASVTRVDAVDAAAEDADAGRSRTRDEALADENAMITRAQSALARGRAGEALEAVHEHEREFPRGRFVEEREVLAIQALSRLGRTEQAAARAERFYTRFPSSMLTRVVRSAVGAP